MILKIEKGITIVALIITIILMLILVGVGTYYGGDALDKARLEDIKTNMISIRTKAKIVAEQYNFKDIDNLVGTKLDTDDSEGGIQSGDYSVSNELKQLLESKNEEGESLIDIDNLYVWTKEDLNNQGLNTIDTDNSEFYIVYYNLNDTNKCEIYYSQGFEGKYTLTELENM